jgi:hypothetical protein
VTARRGGVLVHLIRIVHLALLLLAALLRRSVSHIGRSRRLNMGGLLEVSVKREALEAVRAREEHRSSPSPRLLLCLRALGCLLGTTSAGGMPSIGRLHAP